MQMGSCPKCGEKLRLYNMGQICPHCGVNMRFYGFEEQFYHDAKLAELSVANMNVKLRRFRVAFIGGKLPVARLCLMLLPIVSLLLPTASASLQIPFEQGRFTVSALGLYTAFSDGTLGLVGSMTAAQHGGQVFTLLCAAVAAIAVSTVCAVAAFLMCVLCFFSIKKMSAAICAVSVLGAAGAVAAGVLSGMFVSAASEAQLALINSSMSFGFIITVVCFAALFAVNLLIAKNGLPVKYEEGDEQRAELYARHLRGELDIDSLPQPIVETAATRAIDEEIIKERSKLEG